jgi:hypothetical protein
MKKAKRRTAKHLLPDEFLRRGLVIAPVPAAQGGPLRGHYNYNLETRRHEGRWHIHIQWIELRDRAQFPMVVDLPHEVLTCPQERNQL